MLYLVRKIRKLKFMIKLGKLTDYAVVIMSKLCDKRKPSLVSACYISSKTEIPEPTVAKILKKLSKGGLLSSVRGASGGYKLAKPADQISLFDVVTSLDGPVSIVSCMGEGSSKNCVANSKCNIKCGCYSVNQKIIALLKDTKLVDLIDNVDKVEAVECDCYPSLDAIHTSSIYESETKE